MKYIQILSFFDMFSKHFSGIWSLLETNGIIISVGISNRKQLLPRSRVSMAIELYLLEKLCKKTFQHVLSYIDNSNLFKDSLYKPVSIFLSLLHKQKVNRRRVHCKRFR